MPKIEILIAAFPVVFLFHDFEEIIMFKPWLQKNRTELKLRFPKFELFLSKKRYFDLSTSSFVVAVSFIFLVISIITFLSLWYDNYYWWFAAFMVFFLHLFVHIAQWVIYKKYVPVIITSILVLPYCFYTFFRFNDFIQLSTYQMILWIFIGITITAFCFPIAFCFASKFENWRINKYLNN